MIRFRAVTYNVHKCRGMDRRVDERRIAGVLAELNADVIALQEVLDRQAEEIAAELAMPYALGENRRHQGYGYGNVVLSRGAIEGSHNYDLSVRGREERGCLRADVVLRGAPLLQFVTHAQLHVARRGVGEGDPHDAFHRRARGNRLHHAVHQRGGLAGAGRGLHHPALRKSGTGSGAAHRKLGRARPHDRHRVHAPLPGHRPHRFHQHHAGNARTVSFGHSRSGTLSSTGKLRVTASRALSAIITAVISRPGTMPPRNR